MSHFAKVNNGIVEQVSVAEVEFFTTFVDTSPGTWLQTSYNTHGGQHPEDRPLRKNFAGIGYTYDVVRDAFIAPKPFPSWVLNTTKCVYEAPIPIPSDVNTDSLNTDERVYYDWDEELGNWVRS